MRSNNTLPKHTPQDIQARIQNKLSRIYAPADADEAMKQLQSLIDTFMSTHSTAHEATGQGRDDLALSEQDIILICYGDHVQEDDKPPLQVLHQFLKSQVHPIVNSVHILPFYPYSSDDGFSVIDYEAVNPELGTWAHISAMKDDFRLMFDAVFNHISAKSDWFQKFLQAEAPYTDYFVTVAPDADVSDVVRPRALPLITRVQTAEGVKHVWTTFSDDQIDLNFANVDVLVDITRILLLYVGYGAEFIRLDAIAFLWKEVGTTSIHLEQTHLIIQLMRDVLDWVAPQVVLITETNVPHTENISYFGDGRNEAQMVYQFPLPPLVLHTLLAGDSTRLTQWAQSLDPIEGRNTYFNFTASHDGIGMRPTTGLLSEEESQILVDSVLAHGGYVSYKANSDGSQTPYELNITYFDAITDPAITAENPSLAVDRFIVSQAIQLALAGVPGIYFHNLFGIRNWREGVALTARNRTINRRKLERYALEEALANPDSLSARVFQRYKHLLSIRRQQPAMHPLASQHIINVGASVVAIKRVSRDGQSVLFALHNITGDTVSVTLPAGQWRDLLGDDTLIVEAVIDLQAYQVAWLAGS